MEQIKTMFSYTAHFITLHRLSRAVSALHECLFKYHFYCLFTAAGTTELISKTRVCVLALSQEVVNFLTNQQAHLEKSKRRGEVKAVGWSFAGKAIPADTRSNSHGCWTVRWFWEGLKPFYHTHTHSYLICCSKSTSQTVAGRNADVFEAEGFGWQGCF